MKKRHNRAHHLPRACPVAPACTFRAPNLGIPLPANNLLAFQSEGNQFTNLIFRDKLNHSQMQCSIFSGGTALELLMYH